MIAPLPGWVVRFDGDAVMLVPPEGRALGVIRYEERVRPLRSIQQIARDIAEYDPSFEIVALSAPRPLITHEGEYAAVLVVDGRLDGEPVQQILGAVFGDDFYSFTLALSRDPRHHERFRRAVETLVENDTHFLGVRRRGFLYQEPAGWRGARVGLFHAHYRPRDAAPDARDEIVVSPAVPAPAARGELVEGLVDAFLGEVADRSLAPIPRLAGGLVGRSSQTRGPDGARIIAILEDDCYLYQLTLVSERATFAHNRALFLELCASVQSIPRPRVSSVACEQLGALFCD